MERSSGPTLREGQGRQLDFALRLSEPIRDCLRQQSFLPHVECANSRTLPLLLLRDAQERPVPPAPLDEPTIHTHRAGGADSLAARALLGRLTVDLAREAAAATRTGRKAVPA
jgi:hypothetical protein